MNVETLNFFLALGTVFVQCATVALLAVMLLRKRFPDLKDIAALAARFGLWAGFLLSLAATTLSLYYSEVLGFTPCGLCWMQRVFFYPQVVLLAIAAWYRDRSVAVYSIALSVAGLIVALYQHYLQMGGTDLLPCPAAAGGGGIAADCAQRILFEFGYITFPLMSASLFAFLIVLLFFVRTQKMPQENA